MRTQSDDHVVLDQYLGQLFSRLTRIELCDAPAPVVDAYLYRLYSQRLLLVGEVRRAAAFALLSRVAATDDEREAALVETEEQLLLRSQLTYVQEAFAIAHELMHLVMHDVSVRLDLESVIDEVIDINVNGHTQASSAPSHVAPMSVFHRHLLDDLRALHARRGGSDADVWEPANADEFFREFGEFDLAAVYARPNVRLEAVCDLAGATAVTNVLGGMGLSTVDLMATTTLALQHMRLVQLLDRYVARASSDEPDDHLLESVARTSILRTGLAVVLQVSQTDAADERERQNLEQELHAAARRLNRMHTSVVLDHLSFALDLDQMESDLFADNELVELVAKIAANEGNLREFLGFGRAGSDA